MNALSIIICRETFLKACGSLRSGAAPTPINSKMNYVANQLILKIISVQNFFNFSPKNLKTLKKIFFNIALPIF